jgi:tol-pal system protein YbgF
MWRWLLLVWLLTAGCSSSVLGRNDDLHAQIDELKKRVLALQRQAAVSEIEVQRLRQEVATLEAQLQSTGSTPVLQTRARETTPAPPARSPLSSASREAEAVLEETDLEDGAVPEPGTGSRSEEATGKRATLLSPAAQALYDRGYTLYHQQRYLDAEASFRRFLQAYPDSDLADNAQYWIGESRYARQDFAGALAAFRETLSRYPEGNKVPDALLKTGQTLESLGDLEGARRSYREVARRFPDTAAAALAAELLADLSRSSNPSPASQVALELLLRKS